MGRPPGTDAEIEAAREERRVKVAELLINGYSARKIATQLGVHHSTVNDDIAAVRAQWAENQTHSYQTWVARELQRLDYLEEKLSLRLDRGDPAALQVALRIQERRAKYLALDQPTRVIIDDGLTAEIRELAEQVGMTELPAVRAVLGASNS
jgi:hypothetical protein